MTTLVLRYAPCKKAWVLLGKPAKAGDMYSIDYYLGYAPRAVRIWPNGGQFNFARASVSTMHPHGVHRTCR